MTAALLVGSHAAFFFLYMLSEHGMKTATLCDRMVGELVLAIPVSAMSCDLFWGQHTDTERVRF